MLVAVAAMASVSAQNTPTVQVKSIADLVGLRVPTINTRLTALVTGRASENDGGGGVFYYDHGSSATTNRGTCFKPANTSGRWLRQYTGAVNAKWFGAKGDGFSDDTAALVNLCASFPGLCQLYFPHGTYLITQPLVFTGAFTLTGEGKIATQLRWASETQSGSDAMIMIGGETEDYTGYRIEHLTLNGNLKTPLVQVNERRDGSLYDVWFYGGADYAVQFNNSYYMHIQDCKFQNCSGDGIVLNGASANRVTHNSFHDLGGRAIYYASAGNGDMYIGNSFESLNTALEMPKSPSQGIMTFYGNYTETVTNHFVIGESGSGSTPGPIIIEGNAFASTSPSIKFLGGITHLRFAHNQVGCGVVMSTNVEQLWLEQNIYPIGGITNNALQTIDADDVSNPSFSGDLRVSNAVRANNFFGTNNARALRLGAGDRVTTPSYSLQIETTEGTIGDLSRYITNLTETIGWRVLADQNGPIFSVLGSNQPARIFLGGTNKFSVTPNGLRMYGLFPTYANNAAALSGGLVAGEIYRTGGDPDVINIVH